MNEGAPALPTDEPSQAGDGYSASFLGSVNIVLLTYAADALLAFATGLLMARALGPDGRGAYSLFAIAAVFGQLVLGLGAGNAAIYYINRREIAVRDVMTAMHALVAASVVVTLVCTAAVAPWFGDEIFGQGISPWLLVAAVPVLLHMNLLRLVLQALSRWVDLGVVTVGQQALILALVIAAVADGDSTASQMALILVAASAVAGVYALLRIGVATVDWRGILRPPVDTIRRLARFGVQGEAGNLLQLANYRVDQYIVRAFVSVGGVGIYAVGVSLTEAIFVLANAVALVLMPRFTSASDEDVAWMAPVAARNTVLVCAASAVALAIVAPVIIPLAYGDDFRDSVQALWWLLPGTVALTGSKVLTSYIFSRGRPLVNTIITIVSLVVTIATDFALVPVLGVNGAAIASSVGYIAHFAAALYAYQRISGRPAREALLPHPSDIRLYTDAIRGALHRLGRGATAQAGG
jgi:O-antigen/teichoic acid export membrane protein